VEFFVELVESPLELTTTVVHICSIEESGVSFGASSLLSCISLFDLIGRMSLLLNSKPHGATFS